MTPTEIRAALDKKGYDLISFMLRVFSDMMRQQNLDQKSSKPKAALPELDIEELLTDHNRAYKIKRVLAQQMITQASADNLGELLKWLIVEKRNEKAMKVLRSEKSKGNGKTFGIFYGITQALLMGSFLLAPVIAKKLGPVKTVVLFQLTSIPFFLALAFAPAAMPALAVCAYLMRHPCMNMAHPVAANFMMSVASSRQRARLNGVKQLANKMAWVIATWAGLRIVNDFPIGVDGFTTVMLMTIFFYVVGASLYWMFFKNVSPDQREELQPRDGA